MSNKPKIRPIKAYTNPFTVTKIKTPARLRIYNHIGDMAGCGTIRVITPSILLNSYYSKNYQFESLYNNRYVPHPAAYDMCSYITFQRSATQQQLEIIKHLKKMAPTRKIIYEIDDDLMSIPSWNFASGFYNENRKWIQEIIRIVDGIICSTETLKNSLFKYNNNIRVSENHLPQFIWGTPTPRTPPKGKVRIVYAGSHNHFDRDSDKGDFSPELIDFVSKTTKKYQWIFVGGIPNSLKGDDDIMSYYWQPVLQYPGFLKSIEPDIMLAPLEDIPFNRSKSNIKALESCALGVPLISTNIDPYENLECSVDTTEEFISLIEELSGDEDRRYDVWSKQYNTLKDQLFWESNDYKNLLGYVNEHLRLIGKEL